MSLHLGNGLMSRNLLVQLHVLVVLQAEKCLPSYEYGIKIIIFFPSVYLVYRLFRRQGERERIRAEKKRLRQEKEKKKKK